MQQQAERYRFCFRDISRSALDVYLQELQEIVERLGVPDSSGDDARADLRVGFATELSSRTGLFHFSVIIQGDLGIFMGSLDHDFVFPPGHLGSILTSSLYPVYFEIVAAPSSLDSVSREGADDWEADVPSRVRVRGSESPFAESAVS